LHHPTFVIVLCTDSSWATWYEIKALESFKTSLTTCLITQCHFPQHLNLKQHQCEHLKSHTYKVFHIINEVTFMIYFHTNVFKSSSTFRFPVLMLLLITSDALSHGDKPLIQYNLYISTFKICTLTHSTKIPIFQLQWQCDSHMPIILYIHFLLFNVTSINRLTATFKHDSQPIFYIIRSY
jgi:hypothetical protein